MTLTWWATTSCSSRAIRTRSSSTARRAFSSRSRRSSAACAGQLAAPRSRSPRTAMPSSDRERDRDGVVGQQEGLVERQVVVERRPRRRRARARPRRISHEGDRGDDQRPSRAIAGRARPRCTARPRRPDGDDALPRRQARHARVDQHPADHEGADDHDGDEQRVAAAQRQRQRHGEQRDDDPALAGLVERRVLAQQLERRVERDQRRDAERQRDDAVGRGRVPAQPRDPAAPRRRHAPTVPDAQRAPLPCGGARPPSNGRGRPGETRPAAERERAPRPTKGGPRRTLGAMPNIQIDRLSKRYGDVTAVDDLSFVAREGAVTGFLGPNGAGKTTTLRMLLGLVAPTGGTATIGGAAVRASSPRRRATSARCSRPLASTPAGARATTCACWPPRRGLPADARRRGARAGRARRRGDRRVKGFSLGMRQRLGLAGALLGDPQVLILDEPANGLDPEGVHWLRGFLRAFADDGGTVLVSSHLLAEVAQTVDDVVIIARGRLVAQSPLADLTRRSQAGVRVRTPQPEALRSGARRAAASPPSWSGPTRSSPSTPRPRPSAWPRPAPASSSTRWRPSTSTWRSCSSSSPRPRRRPDDATSSAPSC